MSKWKKSSEELKEKFISTLLKYSGVDHKKMFGYPCCFLRGNMFTGLHEENWVLRLSENDRELMTSKYEASIFAPMKGRVMKEYRIVPLSILDSEKLLNEWINRSIQYVTTLPEKVKK
ncbi:MAG: TfoX/Sxy family protein [Simkaniaceae bacterium]